MKVIWKTVTGSQAEKPLVIDKNSSAYYAYLRRNIQQIVRTDERGNSTLLWQYEEAIVTQNEFESYDTIATELFQAELSDFESAQAEHNAAMQANIEYIAMMTDVDLEG